MPYLLLIHEPVGQRLTRTEPEGRAVFDQMVRFGGELKKKGQLLAMESLAAPGTASRVSVRGNAKPLVLDGPFAEAKEFVGGFFLLDVGTRDEALAIAADCPAAGWATVEVRETGPCFE